MKYKCIDNYGIEEHFTEGEVYEGYPNSSMLKLNDDYGIVRICFPERFEKEIEVKFVDYYDEFIGCKCSTSNNPPCTYCENGGWCQEHQEYRHDCGCEWDEIEPY